MELIETSVERRAVLATPPRRSCSIRRTSSVQVSWPDGMYESMHVHGAARDLMTLANPAQTEILASDQVDAVLDSHKVIMSVESSPPLPSGMALVGQNALKGFRKAIAPVLDEPGYAARPLAQMLDDFVGTSVISSWIYAKWAQIPSGIDRRTLRDVCIGYATGSTAFDDMSNLSRSYIVPPTEVDDDPLAFHELGPQIEATVRRLRRIDVWREGSQLMIDAMFSDSGVLRDPIHRTAIHEYRLQASAEGGDGEWRLASIAADPGALPYNECRAAPLNLNALIGTRLSELRQTVLRELRGSLGCTHLNDAARSLAEAGVLAEHLAESRISTMRAASSR